MTSILHPAVFVRSWFRVLFLAWVFAAATIFSQDSVSRSVVVLGDSIAAGYGLDQSEAFPALLQKKIEAARLPFKVVNAGLSGDTTAGGVRRITWLLKRPIDVLIVELGGNDGLRGISPSETRSNLEKIIDAAREKNPAVKIVLAGMQMPQNMGAEYVRQFKEVFPEVAQGKKVTLIPFLLEGVGGKAELNQGDRIHPNARGHQIVADTVWATLEPVLKSANTSDVRAEK